MSENRRIILFLEDESEMTHQEGLDVFQNQNTKELFDYRPYVPGFALFPNQRASTYDIN